jgi:hypothetical protein
MPDVGKGDLLAPAVVAGSRTILRFVNLMEGGRMHEYS